MLDFLTFKTFVSTNVLILFYYMGALVMPLLAWYMAIWVIRKFEFARLAYEQGKEKLWNLLTSQQKTKLILIMAFFFLFMELMWRMMFEFLIAYMQIRDVLVQSYLSGSF